MPFVYPDAEVCLKFSEIVAPLFGRLRANVDESTALTQVRDFLLPRLMSGEVRVKDVEKIVEAAA
jgi:type I restriction enzyme, S subunit